jgi:hypothetical protein
MDVGSIMIGSWGSCDVFSSLFAFLHFYYPVLSLFQSTAGGLPAINGKDAPWTHLASLIIDCPP